MNGRAPSAKGGAIDGAGGASPRLTARQLDALARLLIDRAGLEPGLLAGRAFESLVHERVRLAAGGETDRYIELLRDSSEESERLILGIAVPETWLFRYPRSFELLLERLKGTSRSTPHDDAPVWSERPKEPPRRRRPIRLLSIGCANGAEAWSIAATCAHAGLGADEVLVRAVDRSRSVLALAERGELPASALRPDAPAWGAERFARRDGAVVVDPALLALVRFEHAEAQAVAAELVPRSCTAIFFRNVLIYLGAELRRHLLAALAEALADDGLLFLGHADHVAELPAQLRPTKAPHAFAFERRATDAAPTTVRSNPRSPDASATNGPPRSTRAIPTIAPGSASTDPVGASHAPNPRAPDASAATLADARRLADLGRLAEADDVAGALIDRAGVTAEAAELRGLIASARNDHDASQRWLEQAIYLQPDRATSLVQLALLCERGGDARRAAALRVRAARAERRDGDDGGRA